VLLKLAYELGYLSAEKLEYWLNRVLQMFVKRQVMVGLFFARSESSTMFEKVRE